MNFKFISKYTFLIFFYFLLSCKSVEILKEKKEIVNNNFSSKEKNLTIDIFSNFINDDNKEDFYDHFLIKNWKPNNDSFKKLFVFNSFDKKFEENKPLIKFIYNEHLVSLNSESDLEFFELKNFKKKKYVNLKLNFDNRDFSPTSIARLKDNFYASYSFGQIISFDLNGKIIWNINLNDLIKTPIKIFNESIIVLSSNKIISIDHLTGVINWEFLYDGEDHLEVLGGDIVDLNHLLFFTLPNNMKGEIDTIFGEKNNSIFTDFNFDKLSNIPNYKLHPYNDLLSIFSQNKYLTTLDINNQKKLLNEIILENVITFSFFKNSIIYLDKNKNLKAKNIINNKLFWENNLKKILNKNNKIVNIFSTNESLIIFFDNGQIIEINFSSGDLIYKMNLKIDNILQVRYSNGYFIIDQVNGKTSIYSQ